MTIVYIVRHRTERFIEGVYGSRANAVARIWDVTNDVSAGPEGSDEWDCCYQQFEIVEMPLE